MIFRVMEHYDYENYDYENYEHNDPNEKNTSNEISECFICYEVALRDELQTIRLNNQTDFIKLCDCNGWIHKKCLNDWFEQAHTCPICRKNIQKAPTFLSVFAEKSVIIVFPLTIIKNMYRLIKFFVILGFLYCTYDLYLHIFNFKTVYDEHSCVLYINSTISYTSLIASPENTN